MSTFSFSTLCRACSNSFSVKWPYQYGRSGTIKLLWEYVAATVTASILDYFSLFFPIASLTQVSFFNDVYKMKKESCAEYRVRVKTSDDCMFRNPRQGVSNAVATPEAVVMEVLRSIERGWMKTADYIFKCMIRLLNSTEMGLILHFSVISLQKV